MFLYPLVSTSTASLNSGSYLNQTDYDLFYKNNQSDFWFSKSDKDAIEVSIYDLDKNLLFWKSSDNLGGNKNVQLTYYDNKNNAIPYSYNEFVFNYPLYKNSNILINPINDFSASTLTSGSYILSYQFSRYMAGSPVDPLVIKDISPNKTELKLIPSKNFTIEYEAFCVGKVPVDDVSPLYLTLTKNCEYSDLYKNSQTGNESAINLIKNLFFISSDGKFVEFLKGLYEDYIKYSTQSNERVESYIRIQGIKTYFSNFLISNNKKIDAFDNIRSTFNKFVLDRINILFTNYTGQQYLLAKQYLIDLFCIDYFLPIHTLLSSKYKEKFESPLKNALCFASGKYIPILSTSYIDERIYESDPLTLLVKLQSPLDDSLSTKSSVWVSNIGMIPFLFNCILKGGIVVKTIKISSPDFTITSQNTSITNTNTYFNSSDLVDSSLNENLVGVSKKINELNVDYTSLTNFIVFSSAELRHTIFKNKMISLTTVNDSLTTLETAYSSSGYSYQYYTTEKETLQTQQSDVINSFDGFESYLYKTGYYEYSSVNRTFSSSSFVDNMDEETTRYDKYNRDSLVNNTPEHITTPNSGNDEYLIFLSMVGHYFDNLYLYIASLPSEHSSDNVNSIARNILQQMLQSFGWKLDASLDLLNISDNFLDTQLDGNTIFSADERTRQIWNRILNTLPLIYKTKGTDACIRLVLSCYGIPSTLINIKEYGGIDYSSTDKTSYTIDEKIFMLIFKGYNDYIKISFNPITHSPLQTIEFKVSLDTSKNYEISQKIPLATKYNEIDEIDWTIGVYKELTQYMGRVYFEVLTPTYKCILSDSIPIFNNEIFNVMVRKNNYDELFEYNSNPDLVPTKYDLRIQRKDDSRIVFNSYNSDIFTKNTNLTFDNTGSLYFGNYQSPGSFIGLMDKILLWDSPIADSTFDDHCNNINSYSYTGSFVPHETLYFRMNFDYPQDLSTTSPYTIINANEYYSSSVSASAYNFNTVAYSCSLDNCVYVSHSVYPYQFKEVSYNQTFTIRSYGPNKFSNQKVQSTDLNIAARLDPIDRSTYSTNTFISPDSNQIGLFADPNDYKNKDIFRYLGDYGVIELIADPSQMFDDKYQPLKDIRELYNSSGNKKVLYNEMFTLYKFYFDKSIFETIKQLIPVRNNVLSGILIEPTVLERPKYQYKRLSSDAGILEYTSSTPIPITSSNTIPSSILSFNDSIYCGGTTTSECVSADFGIPGENVSFNLTTTIDLSKPTLLTANYPIVFNDGVINDIGNYEELGVQCDSIGRILEPVFSGSLSRYLLKSWNKDYTYVRVGEYTKPQTMSSQSIYLCNTEVWNAPFFVENVYTSSYYVVVKSADLNKSYVNGWSDIEQLAYKNDNPNTNIIIGNKYYHDVGTFKQTPNSKTNNLYQSSSLSGIAYTYGIMGTIPDQYYEIMGGYSRNHLTHKKILFSNESWPQVVGNNIYGRYTKSKQTIDTTVDLSGLTDNSLPIQSVNVSNINMVQTDNVLDK